MDAPKQPIDEYTLAAFIAGTLPDERRDELVTYLAQNADARELLQMAYDALEASKRVDEPLAFPAQPAVRRTSRERAPARPATARPARRGPQRTARPFGVQRLMRYAAVAVLMFSIGLSLNLFLGDDTDALRSTPSQERTALDVRIGERTMALQWTAVPDAYQYRVVVFDPDAAEVVARFETPHHTLDADDAFPTELRDRLRAGRTYQLRVDAYSVQNRRIASAVTDFTPAG